MRIEEPSLPKLFSQEVRDWASTLVQSQTNYLRRLVQQVNQLSEGRVQAASSASTAAPTGGDWAAGDFVRNSAPAEAGSASSKYVIIGWIYDGSAWLECRTLTGN